MANRHPQCAAGGDATACWALWQNIRSKHDRDEERIRLTAELIGALHMNRMDVVVLNDATPGLARHIVTTGIRVYCPDPEAAHAVTRDSMLRAADLDPFLNRMRRIALEHLRA